MPRIVILTPDPADEAFHSRWLDPFADKASRLAEAGLTVEGRSWVNGADLESFDLVLPLLCWGYHRDVPGWRAATADWETRGLPVQNLPSVLRWNSDKAYLGHLAGAGAPVVPTRFVHRVTEDALAESARAFGTDRLVAKPTISASAWQTIVWSPGEPFDEGPAGAALIQPFLPTIFDEGEISLIFIAGQFTHAIRKQPRVGDFRVQPEWGGLITPHAPAPDEFAAAERIVAAVEEPLLYARIDLARDLSGAPALMELELVHPDLYFQHDPKGGAAFVEAVRAAAR
jgi:glutathione synthase/RimK-type ligase-like ATP-grasp enzyme